MLARYADDDTTARAIAYVPMDQAHRMHYGSGYFAVTVDWHVADGTWTIVGSPTVTPVQTTPMPSRPSVSTAGT